MQENISKSFINYDNSLKKYKKYYKINNELNFALDFINNVPTFEFKKDNKILMKGDYNLIGIIGKHNNINNIKYFRWGWDFLYTNDKNMLEKKNENENENIIEDIISDNISKDIILNINNTYLIKKIINYIFDLKINLNNSKEKFFYNNMKNLFLHHIIEIKDSLQIELLLAMTLYITKSDLIWKVNDNVNNVIKYYLLRNVREL